jgi:hypothetical protein
MAMADDAVSSPSVPGAALTDELAVSSVRVGPAPSSTATMGASRTTKTGLQLVVAIATAASGWHNGTTHVHQTQGSLPPTTQHVRGGGAAAAEGMDGVEWRSRSRDK